MNEENIFKEKRKWFIGNKKTILLSISLVIMCILAGIFGILYIQATNTINTQTIRNRDMEVLLDEYYNNWQIAQQNYEQAYQDYEQAYQDYLRVLNEYNIYKQQIIRNTEFSGHFYTVIDWSSSYGTTSHKIELQIPYEEYFLYRLNYPHPSHSYYNKWLVADTISSYCLNSTFVYTTAYNIYHSTTTPTEEAVDRLLSLVQDRGSNTICIRYIDDGIDDFAKYSIETLTEGNGDCEDKTILFVSLCASLGYSCAVFVIEGHIYAGVYLSSHPTHNSQYPTYWYVMINGLPYYTCETTMFGWRIGDLPSSSEGQNVYYRIIEF